MKNFNLIINRQNHNESFYDKAVNSHQKRYEEIRKLTIDQGEDYFTRCLLDNKPIKNHYRLIAIDLSRKLDADPNAIQQIEFVGQLRKLDGEGYATDAGNDQSMFALTILEKNKETILKFSQRNVTVL